MNAPLELRVTRFENDGSWDWRLSDGQGRFLADCEARLAAEPRWLDALRDLPAYLERRRGAFPVEHDLAELGEWLGKAAFGPVAAELVRRRRGPATVVRVVLLPEALPLVSFPLELAYLGEPGKPLALAGVRLVYELDDGGEAAAVETRPMERALRVLAVFSLPNGENPLNLRRERRELETLVEWLAQAQGLGVDLRVLQYGATRKTLEDALREGDGWDLIHLSGHGLEGEFVLEDPQGEPFFTKTRGTVQRLANGNTLINVTDEGYAFEVTKAGQKVWEMHNPHFDAKGRRATIEILRRLTKDEVAPVLSAAASTPLP